MEAYLLPDSLLSAYAKLPSWGLVPSTIQKYEQYKFHDQLQIINSGITFKFLQNGLNKLLHCHLFLSYIK
jgi:hypothetical protein